MHFLLVHFGNELVEIVRVVDLFAWRLHQVLLLLVNEAVPPILSVPVAAFLVVLVKPDEFILVAVQILRLFPYLVGS